MSDFDIDGFEKPDDFTRPSFDDDLQSSIQQKRLRQIYERHDHVYNLNSRLLAADVRLPQGQKNTLLRQAVEDYISEVKYLMQHEAPEVGREYWTDYDLGTVYFTCPRELRDELSTHSIIDREPADTKQTTFTGLESLLNAPNILTKTFTAKVPPRGGSDRGHLESVATKQIPRHVLLSARDAVNEFLGHVGIDFRITDQTDDDLFGPVTRDEWNESFRDLVREVDDNGEFEDLLVEVDE